MLKEYSTKYGFQVEAIEKKQYQGRIISSTYIKEELKKGNVSVAEELIPKYLSYFPAGQNLKIPKKTILLFQFSKVYDILYH